MKPYQPPDSSSVSITTSPPHDVAKLMGRRSLSNIPKDQRTLLERETSWAVDRKDGPHGLATVPSHVLETLKQAFIRLQDENDKDKPKDKAEESTDPPPAPNEPEGQNGYSPGSTPARSNRALASSPERSVSWSPSPERAEAQEDEEMSDAGSPVEEAEAEEAAASPFAPLTQPPQQLFHDTPSPTSSPSASEPEDLEMELPQAQETQEVPINREAPANDAAAEMHPTVKPHEPTSVVASTLATINDTPPCAQPLVASAPCTSSGDPKPSVLPVEPTHSRPRRMKPIEFSEDSPKLTARSTHPGPSTRMPSMRIFNEANVQDSTPLSSSNSAPDHDGRAERFPSPPPPPPPPHNFAAKDITPQSRTTLQLNEANSRDMPTIRQDPMFQLYRIQEARVDMCISECSEPYGAFTATYPDYVAIHSGSLSAFIQACVYLDKLQKDKAIREYLYDEFIRAWSSDYMRHVRNPSPSPTPLPVIEWFNTQKGAILFNRMCVKANNISVVLSAYPEDVARVRAIIEKIEEENASEEPEPDPAPEPEPKRRRKRDREPEVVDLVDSDNAMDINMTEESQAEQQLPPPTRIPPSLPAPSRAAPPPPPRAVSPELGSTDSDFDSPPFLPKPPSAQVQQSRSRSRPHMAEPRPQSKPPHQPQPEPQPQPQLQLQPQREMTLPERHSPRRPDPRSHSIPTPIPPIPNPLPSSTAPPLSTITTTTTRPPKSTKSRSSHPPVEHVTSTSRSAAPRSRSRAIPKPHKRSTEERARLKEHFRKTASSSTSLLGSGIE